MTAREIIDLQLESFFGTKFPQKVQRLVNEELNQGRWVEGYDLAICRGVVGGEEARRLLQIVLGQHVEWKIDKADLMRVVESQLPQSLGANMAWIVDESGAFALTDTLRVARFDGATITWCSQRVSLDGIVFDSLMNGRLVGRAWWGSHEDLDATFVFDFESGELLEGDSLPFEF